jgi:hypothetical protein
MVASGLVGYFIGRTGLVERIASVEEQLKEVEGLDRWLRAGQIKAQANAIRMVQRQVSDLKDFAESWTPSKCTYESGPAFRFVSNCADPPRPAPARALYALVSSQELRTASKPHVIDTLLRVEKAAHRYNMLVASFSWQGGQVGPDSLPPDPIFFSKNVPAQVGERFTSEAEELVKEIKSGTQDVAPELEEIRRELDQRYDRVMKGAP